MKERTPHNSYLENLGLGLIKKGSRYYFVDKSTQKVLSEGFHSWRVRPDLDNQIVIKHGSIIYIVDSRGRKRHRKGYHRIVKRGQEYIGKLGSQEEKIRLR